MQDDVRADLYYRFEPGAIRMGYRIEEPKDVIHTDDYRIQISLGPILQYDSATQTYSGRQFAQAVPAARLAEALEGIKLTVKPRDGGRQSYPYSRSIQAFPGPSETVRIEGAYGPLTLQVDAPRKGYIWARIYEGMQPCNGYSIAFRKDDITSPADTSSGVLVLDIQ
jgi:hypothetical protein